MITASVLQGYFLVNVSIDQFLFDKFLPIYNSYIISRERRILTPFQMLNH